MAVANEPRASAGTKFSIATGAPTTFDAAGFAAQTYNLIGRVKTGGEFDKEFEIIASNYLDQRGTTKAKGTWNAGSLSLEVDIDPDDVGQVAAEAAVDSDDNHSVKIELSNGVIYYARALVTSFRRSVGGPNDMLAATITLDLNPIPATGGDVALIKVAA